MAHPGGRPPKLTKEQRAEVYKAFEDYIARTPDPIIVGFCAWDDVAIKYNVLKHNIEDWEEFSALKARAVQKSEAYLATGVATGKLNASGSIFRLKQPVHGYTDKVEQAVDVTSKGEQIKPSIDSDMLSQFLMGVQKDTKR